jgi:cytochrome c551/c552
MAQSLRQAGVLLMTAFAAVAAHAETDAAPAYTKARDAGCVICHEVESTPHGASELLPAAPAFEDVACRYRSDPNAPAKLSSTIIHGSGPRERDRHWAGRATFDKMFPNELIVSEAEAREIVDWILTLCPRPAGKPAKRAG